MRMTFLPAFAIILHSLIFPPGVDANEHSIANLSPDERLDDKKVAFFEKHVRPVLIEKCYSCHSEKEDEKEGGLILDSRPGWMAGGENGPVVIPGDPSKSRLIEAIRYGDKELQMPPDRKLADSDIRKFEEWIRMGAIDPRDSAVSKQSIKASDPVAGKSFWSFKPLEQKVNLPVNSFPFAESPIDVFVYQKLEEAGIQPNRQADRKTLVRRVYLTLTGIPPTFEQVQAFAADTRPAAYEQLVDRLLASPEFGERWGRHWLDLARYADSNGLDENFLFREAWRYRNWVFDAINEDLSYDRFLKLQIAGDLLPYQTPEQRDQQRIATGFLVVGPKVLLGINPMQQRMDVADEQIETIGRTVLGQTLGCARCHDHKFDPVPTEDYYSLAGIFTSTQVMQRRYMLGQQRVMEQLVGLGDGGEKINQAYEKFWREKSKLETQLKEARRVLKELQKKDSKIQQVLKKNKKWTAKGIENDSLKRDQVIALQKKWVDELVKLLRPPGIPPRAMVALDKSKVEDESIRVAGQFNKLDRKVPRGFLQVLSQSSHSLPDGQSGRVELANWLVDVKQGGGGLAARVLANRVWQKTMGQGIVRTPDNFGRTGKLPSHPQLLEFLAGELIRSNWSIKHLVRQVVTSEAFRRSSDHSSVYDRDPGNRFLWRYNRRRVEPEVFRDAMLLAADQLDLRPMKSTVWYLGDQATAVGANTNRRRTDFPCRSVYLPVIRNDLPELFQVFDFADPQVTTGRRPQTFVATQGLFVLNDPSVWNAAEGTARRILSDASANDRTKRIHLMMQLTLGRTATSEEIGQWTEFLMDAESIDPKPAEGEARLVRIWTVACQVIFASSHFQILE